MPALLRRATLLLFSLLLPTAQAIPGHRLTLTGLGPARIGMTETQLRSALLAAEWEKGVIEDEASCFHLAPLPDNGLGFMFLNRKLARIDVNSPEWQSFSGVHIGDTEARLRQVYGAQIKEQPHKYTDGKYLYIPGTGPNRNFEMRFETDEKGIVTTFRAGLAEATALVEGCA